MFSFSKSPEGAGRRPRAPRLVYACLLAALTAPAGAELPLPVLVGDYSPGDEPANFVPRQIAHLGGLFYFEGSDPQHGEEPWVSDGTPAGTRLLADLCPGYCASAPRAFTAIGDRVVFLSQVNSALYAIDGGRVEEIARGLGRLRGGITVLDGVAFFSGGLYGENQWRSDGTAAGTRPSGDFCSEPPHCSPYPTDVPVHGGLYFVDDGALHLLLREGERRRLTEMQDFSQLTPIDATRVIFQGCQDNVGCSAFVSDGTPAGTLALEHPEPITYPLRDRSFQVWQGRVYFEARGGGMLSTDGTPAGTRAEPSFSGSQPRPFAVTPLALLYSVDGTTTERSLRARRADGGDALLVADSPRLRYEGQAGGKIFFYTSQTLMATDGTPAGTHSLEEAFTSSSGVDVQGIYYFGLDPNGGALGGSLWRSDGTPAGSAPIDLGKRYPRHTLSYPSRLGSTLALRTLEPAPGLPQDLYFLDPVTFALSDPHPAQVYPVAIGRHLYYAATAPGRDLIAFSDHGAAVAGSIPSSLEVELADDDHLFYAPQGIPGQRLFASDGTAGSARLLFDLDPSYDPSCHPPLACPPSFPQEITASGENVFLAAPAADRSGLAVWVWSRTGGEPREVLRVGTLYRGLTAIPGSRIFFTARRQGSAVRELWVSDGTPAGTRSFAALPGTVTPEFAALAGNRLFFTLDGTRGSLWVTDFTAAGTVQLLQGDGLEITRLVAAGDHVYFTGVSGPGRDAELGFSDGTLAGSRWLEVVPGPRGLRPEELFVLDDRRLVFAGSGDGAGQELWISDGSLPGTLRLTDLAPGPAASGPIRFAQLGHRLFFNANDGVTGIELWRLDLPALPPSCPEERLCLQNGRFEVKATALVPQPDGSRRRFPGRRALGREESGVFTFFSGDNWEMLVKVLDACAIDGSYWVLASAASDIAYELEVLDRADGTTKRYLSPAGAGRPILDLATGLSCSAPPVAPAYAPLAPSAPAAARCTEETGAADGEQLCLGPAGRYRVKLDWQTADGAGRAHPIAEGSPDSGLFTFFSASNWEMMVKVLDGCAINGKVWVFAAGTTDVGWTLEVEDSASGQRKVYRNTLGQPSPTLSDAAAFPCR